MQQNNVRLILRSHEGPDARIKRPHLQNMDEGYTVDYHEDGKLLLWHAAWHAKHELAFYHATLQ